MKNYIERMEKELIELSLKTEKLDCFVHTVGYFELPHDARFDLDRQLCAMREYRKVLAERVAKAGGVNLYPDFQSAHIVSGGGE
ncbi:hypothetical protein NVP1167O_05 [Vibrio phage 1.167.O._10N.261.51.F2]|nr:hypothetical protein NVP1167O_05 [Vibrio phage 1.167.O._10N.261.51.F2]